MWEIYICITLYHLYLSLLFINKRKSKDWCMILLNANDTQIYSQFCKLEIALREHGYRATSRLRNKTKDMLGFEEIKNKYQYKMVEGTLGSSLEENFILFNFAWNLQYIYSTANLFFKKCKESYFIEEGVLTAINPPQSNIKVVIKKLMGTIVDFYKYEKLKGIYVQKPNLYPNTWKSKLYELDMNILINSLIDETRQLLLEIFLRDYLEKIDITSLIGCGIIYTQPLTEDGYVTNEEKIDYYTKMVKFYSKYGMPVVKIHPRDLTDYKFEAEYIVLPSYFPSELLNLLNIQFKYAVGICTSAVLTTNAVYKVNINENFLRDRKFALKSLE